jgi:hypothetical protein
MKNKTISNKITIKNLIQDKDQINKGRCRDMKVIMIRKDKD